MSHTNCAHCGKPHHHRACHVNRALKDGYRLFCSRRCFGLDRRKWKSKAQKKVEKRIYDAAYRRKNQRRLRAEKRAYHKRTYNKTTAAITRKAQMSRHVEYCRRPEYKKYKSRYDRRRRETNPRARLGLPQWTPDDLIESIDLLQTIRKEQKREHQRS